MLTYKDLTRSISIIITYNNIESYQMKTIVNLPGELLITFLKASSAIPILSKRSLCPPVLLVSISDDVNAIRECKY